MRPDRVEVGKVTSAVGIKGEVRVYPYTDYVERFEELDSVFAGEKKLDIDSVRYQKNMAILKFRGVDDRNGAEKLRDSVLTIGSEDLRELDEDEYFIFDLVGLEAVDTDGVHIGRVTDVLQNTAQDLYEIEDDEGRTHLVPAVYEIVTEIDIKNGIMVINKLEGLFER